MKALKKIPYYFICINHYANVLYYSSISDYYEAKTHLDMLENSINLIPTDSVPPSHQFYPYHKEMGILMKYIASTRVLWYERKYEEGIELLKRAVQLQDSFQYMEPDHFYLPIKQCLAAALLNISRIYDSPEYLNESVKVYEEELLKNPNQGWTLRGLYEAQVNTAYKDKILHQFNISWLHSDIRISGSCCELAFC